MLTVEWKASAYADLTEIFESFVEHSELAAENLFDRIQRDLEHAAEHPYLFKASHRLSGLREIVTHPNYIIFYRVRESCIEVVNIVHARREFPKSSQTVGTNHD